MDNIETTETKTEIKNGIAYIIGLVIVATIFGVLIWFKSGDREPFLFGYVWDANFILIFFQMVMFVAVFVSLIGQPKGKKQIIGMILCAVMFALEAGLIVWYAYENGKKNADTEQITLSDGSKVMLSERIDYIAETKIELTYMYVYQIKGITAKKLGKIDESYFSNKCLLQDKYTYEYDEANKKLTIICEYGTFDSGFLKLKEEYDTGFWEKEFILE